jgi:hypothetical protein
MGGISRPLNQFIFLKIEGRDFPVVELPSLLELVEGVGSYYAYLS